MTLIKKPSELPIKTTYFGMIYGMPGCGKTTAALSAESPLLIDCEQGIYRGESLVQCDSIQVESWKDCLNILNEDLSGYKTIIVDTFGKLFEHCKNDILQTTPKLRNASNGSLTLQGYGLAKNNIVEFAKQLMSLGKSVIFVAHEKEEKDGELFVKRPMCEGGSINEIIKELDWMGYMYASGTQRMITFEPTDRAYTKNSMGLQGEIKVPDITGKENRFVQDYIVKAIIERQQKKLEDSRRYNEIKTAMSAMIDDCKQCSDFDRVMGLFAKVEHIWDSKIWGWNEIQTAASKMSCSYDKLSGKWLDTGEKK